MKVRGLDGREYNWRLAGHGVRSDDDRPRSQYHLRARALLRRIYPADRLLEEVFLPGLSTAEYADFVLPLRRLVIEVQGQQHTDPDHYFHGDRMAYLRASKRDQDKRLWCELNDLSLVELPFSEKDDDWSERIFNAHTHGSAKA